MESSAEQGASASLLAASSLMAGLAAGQGWLAPRIGLACALLALGLACGGRRRLAAMPAAAGLLLAWSAPALRHRLPGDIDPRRPVVAVVHRCGAWRPALDGWGLEACVESLRQGRVVRRWPIATRLYAPAPLAGERWRLRAALARSPGYATGGARPARPWRLAIKSGRLAEELTDRRWSAAPRRTLARLRSALSRRLDRAPADAPGAALARALVLGESEGLPESWLRGLRRAGLAHVTALSGLHLGVLAGWCALLSRRAPPRGRWSLIAAATLGYLLIGGARPSLARSCLMVAAAGATALAGRPARSLHALAWAAASLGALDPSAVRELGFQLTFAASAGVILGARRARDGIARGGRALRSALAATTGAQIFTAPIALCAFAWLPLWAWLWNLLLVPVVGVALPVAFLWAVQQLSAPGTGGPLAAVLDLAAALLGAPEALPPRLFGGVPWGWSRSLAAGLAGAAWLASDRRWRRAILLSGLLLADGVPAIRDDGTSVWVLDVGQGDALLIRDGGGALLVDGGGSRAPGIAERALLPALGRRGVRRVEAAILTHGDNDHCRGLLELSSYVAIEEVWLAPAAAASTCGRRLLQRPGVRARPLWAGREAFWRSWRFAVLNPAPGERGGNESSLVLRGESRGRSLMLTGDIGHATEFRILQRAPVGRLRSDLLKVAHHGSAGSSSLSFLRAVDPTLALISVGRRNPFGHPAPGVVARLAGEGVPVLRTDLAGQVGVSWTSGGALRVTMSGPAADSP